MRSVPARGNEIEENCSLTAHAGCFHGLGKVGSGWAGECWVAVPPKRASGGAGWEPTG